MLQSSCCRANSRPSEVMTGAHHGMAGQFKPLNVELRAFSSQLFKSRRLNLPKG